MKKSLLLVIAFIAMSAMAFSQMTARSITIAGTNRTIEIDGYDDDDLWFDCEVLPFEFSHTDMPDPDDCSAQLQIAWNELGLLVMLIITDNQENYFAEGENAWEQDNTEFFFYFGEEGSWGPETAETAVASDSMFSQIRINLTDDYATRLDGRYLGEWGGPAPGSADTGACELLAVQTGTGWNVEGIMPWALFPKKFYEPGVGMKFGFEQTVGDADETIKDAILSLLNDSGTDDAYDNRSYINTAELGEITLLSNIPSHSVNTASVYPTIVDNELNLTGDVNSLVIYDVTGQAVLSFKDNSIKTVDVSALQPGIYFVNLNDKTTQKIIVH
jgi:hypothetical protein